MKKAICILLLAANLTGCGFASIAYVGLLELDQAMSSKQTEKTK